MHKDMLLSSHRASNNFPDQSHTFCSTPSILAGYTQQGLAFYYILLPKILQILF